MCALCLHEGGLYVLVVFSCLCGFNKSLQQRNLVSTITAIHNILTDMRV